MQMKKAFIVAMAALLSVGAMAQTPKGFDKGGLDKMKARTEMRKASMKRDANKVKKDLPTLPVDYTAATKAANSKGVNLPASQLPENIWHPGEWEELQAVVVNFPYIAYPADHLGDDDYTAQIVFPGKGDLYRYRNYYGWQNYGYGSVDGLPDTTDYQGIADFYRENGYGNDYVEYYEEQENFRGVFLNLIDAIQHGSQAWIVIWHLSDSSVVKQFMASKGMPLTNYRFIEAYSNAFWYRDCGPICFYYGDNDDVAMLNFQYSPGRACDDLLPDSIASQTGLPMYTSTLAWEGGNCLVDGYSKLFTSTATLEENHRNYGQIYETGSSIQPYAYSQKTPLSYEQTADSMNAIFGETHFMTRLRNDGGTGHIDLYADMYDENQFVFSKMPEVYSQWVDYATTTTNIDSLTSLQNFAGVNYRAAYIPFPSRDDGSDFPRESNYDSMYTRSYSNHTFINNIIVQPCFSEVVNGNPTAAWDRANIDSVRAAYPGYEIFPIDIRLFDGYGGAIHCITKQIPATSPIRILHSPVRRGYTDQNATIEAYITNNTGIASAKVMYRVENGDWQTINMTNGNGSMFTAEIPTTELNATEANIEYYISVTSNGGKTITKPFTAGSGAYFKFRMHGNTGIETVSAEQNFGQFYPNPATEQASMVIDMQGGKNYSVAIYDLSGREVHSSSLQAQGTIVYSINAARMASGQYTVVFTNGSERVARKLVVK